MIRAANQSSFTIESHHASVNTSVTDAHHYLLQDNVLTLGTELPKQSNKATTSYS